MINLDSVVVVKIDSLLARGNLLELIDTSVAKGSDIDILDNRNIAELDVIIGDYNLKRWNTSKIALEGTEPLVLKLGEMMLNENLATSDECFDIRSILSLISGSAGYSRCHLLIEQKFQDWELLMLVSWLYAVSVLQFGSASELKVGVEAIEGKYRDSEDIKIEIKEIIEAYSLEHTYKGDHLLDTKRITVVPAWWWIQKILNDRKSYNHILKKKV